MIYIPSPPIIDDKKTIFDYPELIEFIKQVDVVIDKNERKVMGTLDKFNIFVVAIVTMLVLMVISGEVRYWISLIQDNNNAKEYAKEQKEYYATRTEYYDQQIEYYAEMINFYRELKDAK